MAKVLPEAAEVNARILYWGIDGAGKHTILENVATKLRPDHRGELTEVPTRFDPSVSYSVLPIELGEIGGTRTRIELVAVPGAPEHAPTRKQLLDQVDGVVLVMDSQESHIEQNATMLEELHKGLADYARRLDELPHVVQYNKRDLSNAYVIDELHRRLGLGAATVFETVATEGTGVLQTLSTISKKVIRALREESLSAQRDVVPLVPPQPAPSAQPAPKPSAPEPAPPAPPPVFEAEEPDPVLDVDPVEQLESAILSEGEDDGDADAQLHSARSLLEDSWSQSAPPAAATGVRLSGDLTIVSVGQAQRVGERAVSLPLVLADGEGATSTLMLTIQLDALTDGTSD
jgi:signal recognition particle receptor subunit beta